MGFEINYISDAPRHAVSENTYKNLEPFVQGKTGGVWTTAKGIKLWWKMTYTKGNGRSIPRCYLLAVQRNVQIVEAGTDLTQPAGRALWALDKVGRRSQQQQRIAIDLAKDKLPQIVDQYDL